MPQIFSRESNFVPFKIALVASAIGLFAVAAIWATVTPRFTRVGYQPVQPINFSHKIHAGQLNLDCRLCHSFVETAAHSNIPTAQLCMNCHSQVQKDNPKLAPLRQAFATGEPINWVQIHKTPDYVYFNHAVHVNRGVSCVSCHGRVDQMEVIRHDKPHTMSWCLDCHRATEEHLRPLDQVFNLAWEPPTTGKQTVHQAQLELGNELKKQRGIHPPDSNCAGCHR